MFPGREESWGGVCDSDGPVGTCPDALLKPKDPPADGLPVPPPLCHHRSPQKDFRFGLLWEWSLYEAMTYSPYVAARLQTYTEKGRAALELLLAKLGIPLQQAQSPYLRALAVSKTFWGGERVGRVSAGAGDWLRADRVGGS